MAACCEYMLCSGPLGSGKDERLPCASLPAESIEICTNYNSMKRRETRRGAGRECNPVETALGGKRPFGGFKTSKWTR